MPKMDYLNAYCHLITAGEEAEKFKSKLEILEAEIDMDKTSKEGNKPKLIYINVPFKKDKYFLKKIEIEMK